jgi:hypothetical protein
MLPVRLKHFLAPRSRVSAQPSVLLLGSCEHTRYWENHFLTALRPFLVVSSVTCTVHTSISISVLSLTSFEQKMTTCLGFCALPGQFEDIPGTLWRERKALRPSLRRSVTIVSSRRVSCFWVTLHGECQLDPLFLWLRLSHSLSSVSEPICLAQVLSLLCGLYEVY